MERMEDVSRSSMAAWMAHGGAIALSLEAGINDDSGMEAAAFTYGGGACGVSNGDSDILAAAGSNSMGLCHEVPRSDLEISAAAGSLGMGLRCG